METWLLVRLCSPLKNDSLSSGVHESRTSYSGGLVYRRSAGILGMDVLRSPLQRSRFTDANIDVRPIFLCLESHTDFNLLAGWPNGKASLSGLTLTPGEDCGFKSRPSRRFFAGR